MPEKQVPAGGSPTRIDLTRGSSRRSHLGVSVFYFQSETCLKCCAPNLVRFELLFGFLVYAVWHDHVILLHPVHINWIVCRWGRTRLAATLSHDECFARRSTVQLASHSGVYWYRHHGLNSPAGYRLANARGTPRRRSPLSSRRSHRVRGTRGGAASLRHAPASYRDQQASPSEVAGDYCNGREVARAQVIKGRLLYPISA